jgi:flagella basal body P-ring formation protein FlgA
MKTSLSSAPIVRQLTIAALLGTLPSIAESQTTRAPHDTTSRMSDDTESHELSAQWLPVAMRDLPRGAVLAASDVGYAQRKTRAAHPVPHSVASIDSSVQPAATNDHLVGWTTRRNIAKGDWLGAPSIEPPQLVKSGDVVEVSWSEGGIRVTTKGLATRSAAAGERVTVRLPAQRTVEASVVAAGQVRVN